MLSLYSKHPGVKSLRGALQLLPVGGTLRLAGLQGSALALASAALRTEGTPYLYIMHDEEEAGYLYHDLCAALGSEHQDEVAFFPSSFRRAVRYGQRDAANEILRTDVLTRLSAWHAGTPLFIVTFPEALAEKVAPREEVESRTITLRAGEAYEVGDLTARLFELGFRRRDYVYEPGEFAVRGSILDVFSFSSDYPFRIDFFGDEVETIRTFEVENQLSRERLTEVLIVPELADAVDSFTPLGESLPKETVLVSHGVGRVLERVQHIYDEGFSQAAHLAEDPAEGGAAPRLSKKLLATRDELAAGWQPLRRIWLQSEADKEVADGKKPQFQTRLQPLYHKNFDLLKADLQRFRETGYTVYLLADSAKQRERLHALLPEYELHDVAHTLHAGFIDDTLRAVFLTDHQIFDRFHKYSLRSDHARDAKMALSLREMMQFEEGDYVVHSDHGIGRFAGLVRMPGPNGEMQEVIKLVYQRDDIVFVSIHSLHKLSKYKGREGEPPRLSRLGTGAWEKMKEGTKRRLKDIARDLIRLYSQRAQEEGFAFTPDGYMQQALEASFTYEDTPDQLRVTAEVKADMERPQPMDRLVCGDVGFGKTEIAVRAAFKAATDGKQVAVLVPTTVLALQHFKTFSSRLADFPVRVDYLSRARTAKETREVLADLAAGRIDILVGTHKLIGKQVVWKDLGLLIIDEEQKFGVSVKEKLRSLRTNLDTLTLSATPIPRTLQFSLMGARDFSVLQTPPPNRRPVRTEVHEFDARLIAEAVEFELSRSGQVFIVTPRVATLQRLHDLVKKYVPDARVAIGHGQMPPSELERVVIDFINYDTDVLISTTIVENGIDIPNANTIIIEGANHFGLSDLHQMRGRVGRSSRKAFCYLLAPPLSALPADARRRLEAIEGYSDLGSGIHIALQDLDIRGAGNLLGAEQSGFIADVGYETYQKILAEAMQELREEELMQSPQEASSLTPAPRAAHVDWTMRDVSVECDLRAFLPETYVPGATERMMLYRELDALKTDEMLAAFRQRLEDRFGALPDEAEELLRIVPLRRLAARFALERLVLKQGAMTLYFTSLKQHPFYTSSLFDALIAFATTHYRRCVLKESAAGRRMVIRDVPSVQAALTLLNELLLNAETK